MSKLYIFVVIIVIRHYLPLSYKGTTCPLHLFVSPILQVHMMVLHGHANLGILVKP